MSRVWTTIIICGFIFSGCGGCEKDLPGPVGDIGSDVSMNDTTPDQSQQADMSTTPDATADLASDAGADLEADMSVDMMVDMGPPPFDDIDEAVIAWLETYCDVVFSCMGRIDYEDLLAMHMRRFPDAATCRAEAPNFAMTIEQFAELGPAVADGRRDFDPFAAQKEIEELERDICQSDGSTRFGGAFGARQVSGGACVLPLDCGRDDYCDRQPGDCHGICTAYTNPNCGNDHCTVNEYCEQDVCVTAKDDGEACQGFRECGFNGTCNNGVCARIYSIPLGDPCTSGAACVLSAYCDSLTSTCVPRIPSGQPCDQLSGGGCEGFCDLNNICADQFSVAAGGACDNRVFCDLASTCDENQQVCIPAVLGNGAVCDSVTRGAPMCDAGLQCQDVDFNSGLGTCLPLRANGEVCVVSWQCELGLQCDLNTLTCAPLNADGGVCQWDYDCNSSRCVDDLCEAAALCVIP